MFKGPQIISFLKEAEIKGPTLIQQLVIPEILNGHSVNVIAKTGSGKTFAFVLPVCELIKELEEASVNTPTNELYGRPKAIVLAPTRELAQQLSGVFKKVSHHLKFRVRTMLGGEGVRKSVRNKGLSAKLAMDVLVATPGRLSAAIRNKELSLSECRYLILDEADQLLDLGFKKDLENIYRSCDSELVHVGLFSATSSIALEEFSKSLFCDVEFKHFNSLDKNKLSQNVKTFNIFLKDEEKIKMAHTFIKKEARGNGIVFVNKHETAELVFNELKILMPKLTFHLLHGEMTPTLRKKNLNAFLKLGGVLISTDITARGMDVKNLIWALNYDLPFEAVYYVHRCGRVGRGDDVGLVYNFVTPKDASIISRINEAIKNQTALKLNTFPERKIVKKIPVAKVEDKKLENKKRELENLKLKARGVKFKKSSAASSSRHKSKKRSNA